MRITFEKIKSCFEEALAKKSLIYTDNSIHIMIQHEIPFQVRFAPALGAKATESLKYNKKKVQSPSPLENGSIAEDKKEMSNNEKATRNPFLPYDPDLYVGSYENHHILLNKFSIVKYHVLLTTKEYKDQFDLLDLTDFKAAFRFLQENPNYFCFYNGGPLSGASIPHRHLQFLPLEDDEAIPIQSHIQLALNCAKSAGNFVNTIQAFQGFIHGFVRLDTSDQDAKATYCHESYIKLLDTLLSQIDVRNTHKYASKNYVNSLKQENEEKEAQLISYNLVLTRDWLLIVPRKNEYFEYLPSSSSSSSSVPSSSKDLECINIKETEHSVKISVNSVAMAGYLLAKSRAEFEFLKECGPMKILSELTFPRN